MCSVRRVSDNSNSFFLNKFNLVEVLLRYAAEDYRAVVEVRLDEGKI
jgi:hypothetical protein